MINHWVFSSNFFFGLVLLSFCLAGLVWCGWFRHTYAATNEQMDKMWLKNDIWTIIIIILGFRKLFAAYVINLTIFKAHIYTVYFGLFSAHSEELHFMMRMELYYFKILFMFSVCVVMERHSKRGNFIWSYRC